MNLTHREWQNLEWLENSRQLIEWANKQSRNQTMMLVVRHSHREDSTDVQELLQKRLTPLGHRMAHAFGGRLPRTRDLQLFYSNHPRCFETAQGISEGYKAIGEKADLVSEVRVLLGPQGSGERIGREMLDLGGPEFIQRWAVGQLSTETIEPIEVFGKVFITETIGRLNEARGNTLQIHVTHDLVLMGARNFLFGTIPTTDNWTTYLGGFGIILKDNVFLAFEGGNDVNLSNIIASVEKPP